MIANTSNSGNDANESTPGIGLRQGMNAGQSTGVTTNGHHTHQQLTPPVAAAASSSSSSLPKKRSSLSGSFTSTTGPGPGSGSGSGSGTGTGVSDVSPSANLLMPIPAVGVVDRYGTHAGIGMPLQSDGDLVDHITSVMGMGLGTGMGVGIGPGGVGVGVGGSQSSTLARPPVRGSPVANKSSPVVVIKAPGGIGTGLHRMQTSSSDDTEALHVSVPLVMLEPSDEDGSGGLCHLALSLLNINHPQSYPFI